MEKKQMILKVGIASKSEMYITDGWGDELGDYLLFLALCRAALIRRAELGQSFEQESTWPHEAPFEIEVNTVFRQFISDELKIEREEKEHVVKGKWIVSGFKYEITGVDARTIVEAAAQELGAQLEMRPCKRKVILGTRAQGMPWWK